MKKRDSATMVIMISLVLVMLVLFFIFQFQMISFFSKSRFIFLNYVTAQKSTKNKLCQESECLALNSIIGRDPHQTRRIVCDRAHNSYDICKINGRTVLDPITSTFFVTDPTGLTTVEKIRPYTRKSEKFTMSRIKELTLVSGPTGGPPCEVQHEVPALVFSAGGYTGNFFHEFNDGFIPLYITVNSFFDDDQELVLVISKSRDWWINKYSVLLRSFSKHQIITLDNDTATHCFPSATLGLVTHGFMTINPKLIVKPKSQSLTLNHFRAFLAKSYTRKLSPKHRRIDSNRSETRPRLILVSRTGGVGRILLNQNKVKEEAEKVGFDVVLFEPSPTTALSTAYELIDSSHAMVGVHGAGLTHSLFLRPGSVFIQVVPLGVDWLAEVCFGKPARAMELDYAEYRISAHESSLIEKYGKEEMVIKDPVAFRGKNWSSEIMDLYLKEQNVHLDLVRFRGYLKEAYRKCRKFMVKEG